MLLWKVRDPATVLFRRAGVEGTAAGGVSHDAFDAGPGHTEPGTSLAAEFNAAFKEAHKRSHRLNGEHAQAEVKEERRKGDGGGAVNMSHAREVENH